MSSKRHKPPTALLKAELERLAGDNCAFDLRVIRSALEYCNEQLASGKPPYDQALPAERATKIFEWLPPVLEARAIRAPIDPSYVKWSRGGSDEDAAIAGRLLQYLVGPTVLRAANAWAYDWVHFSVLGKEGRAKDWLNRALMSLPIYGRYRLDGDVAHFVTVPLLKNVSRALVYAIAIVLEDRWGTRGRIRVCPYRRHGAHFFLDYRTDDEGRLLGGQPQEYCCRAHSNAHRQQVWRERQKEIGR